VNEEILRQLFGTPAPQVQPIRRKVFVSYSHLDQREADQFINRFGGSAGVFVAKVLGVTDRDDFIRSANTEYVMQRIRQLYVQDSTVTIVLVGSCTHSRRYVDWEIKASLQQAEDNLPNGLIAIQLPSCPNGAYLPPRLERNWSQTHQNCFARYWKYPQTDDQLRQWIEDASQARSNRSRWIQNPQEMMKNNAVCRIHYVTH
jgi:hypothetical protein